MKRNKVLIRVDGNVETGLGHIYRGIALAEILSSEFNVTFLLRESSVYAPVKAGGFECVFIPDYIEKTSEPKWLSKKISEGCIVVLDGYDFDVNYQTEIKAHGIKLVFIDDLVKDKMYADLVINYSPDITPEDYKKADYTRFALGPDFMIMRKAFLKAALNKRDISEIDTAFVCFGGSDKYDLTTKIVKTVLDIPKLKKINVVLGASYAHTLIYNLQQGNPKIKIYRNVNFNSLIDVMKESNLGIVPASGILNETLAVGMPVVSGYYTEDQRLYSSVLEDMGIIYNVGDFLDVDSAEIKNAVKAIRNDFEYFLENQKTYITGNSAELILNEFRKIQ